MFSTTAMQSLNMQDPDAEDAAEGSVVGSGLGSPVESGDEGAPKLPKAAIAFFKRTKKHDSASSSVIGGGGESHLLHVIDKNSQVSHTIETTYLSDQSLHLGLDLASEQTLRDGAKDKSSRYKR